MVSKGPFCSNILWLLWHWFDFFLFVLRGPPTHLLICSCCVLTLSSAGHYEKCHRSLLRSTTPPPPPTHPPPKQFIIYLGLSFSSRVSTETGTLCLGDERERTCIWKHRASISRDGWQNIPENKRLSLLLVVVFICSQCSEPLQGDTAVGRKSSCLLAYDCRL